MICRSPSAPAISRQFEVRLTTALLTLGRDVAVGRATAEPGKRGGSRRAAPDVAGSLQRAADSGDLAGG